MKVRLLENFRAVFYAPLYAAFELGAFERAGLDVEMQSPSEFGDSLKALSAGETQVSWGGPMRLMLARDKNPDASGVAFCEVVGRDPFYLIGRYPNPRFQMKNLLEVRVGTVSEVPTPWICLQHDLRCAGEDPAKVSRVTDQTMDANAAALARGEVDVIQIFHPYARTLIQEGVGHLWYAAASRGPACYTTLNTTREFIDANPETVLRMTRAVHETQNWVHSHDGGELARVVGRYFPTIPHDTLRACCDEYLSNRVWSASPVVQREGLEWKRDAMLSSGAIRNRLAYEAYVDMRFANRVVADDPPCR